LIEFVIISTDQHDQNNQPTTTKGQYKMIDICIAIHKIAQAVYFEQLILALGAALMLWAFYTVDPEEAS
tara:strand:- start:11 stop:217 length:207 start_codon:yes stop_codon:yes gene_type:complete